MVTEKKLRASQVDHQCEVVISNKEWNSTLKVAYNRQDPIQLYITQDTVVDIQADATIRFERFNYPSLNTNNPDEMWIWHDYQIPDTHVCYNKASILNL